MHGLDMPKRTSWVLFAFLALVSASLCYSYLSDIAIPVGDFDEVYVVLFAVPVALAVLLLGAPRGVLLAVVTGVLVMFRARWTTITLFDFSLCDPYVSVAGLVVGSALMAAVFSFGKVADPIGPPREGSPLRSIGRARLACVACGCLAFSLALSLLCRGAAHLFVTPSSAEYDYTLTFEQYLGLVRGPWPFVEAALNAAVLFGSCTAALVGYARLASGAWRLSLDATFNRWLALALTVVFLLSTSVSFCAETLRLTESADSELVAELSYLMEQIDERGDEGVASVVRDWHSTFGGIVYVVRDREIVASNDPETVGGSALDALGAIDEDDYEYLLEKVTDGLSVGFDISTEKFLGRRALRGDDYTLILEAPLSSVFQVRLAALRHTIVFLLLVLAAVFCVVHALLRRIVVEPISRTNETLARIGTGELNQRVNERAVTEFDALSNGINATVSALGDTIDEVAQRNVQDLATAKVIQESALPREFPPFPDIDRLDVFASMRPAKEVGGDFYDFFRVGECGLVFLIADVSGKGISGALFMMRSKTQIKNNIMAGMPLEVAIATANHQLCLGNDANMFVTLFCCQLDFETGGLSYVNAGHNPPVLGHGDTLEWLGEVSGLPLGLFDDERYERFERVLDEGDLLYLYTDGVSEALDCGRRPFGEGAILEQLGRTCGMNARSTCAGMRLALSEFTAGAEQSDDVTMLALVYGVPPEPRATMELTAELGHLAYAQHLVHEELHRHGAPSSVVFALDVAVEELFVNVCAYAYPDATTDEPGEVLITCEYDAGIRALRVTLADGGVPFDPLTRLGAVEGDPTACLGIRLAVHSVDELSYERRDGRNVCTITKSW